MSRMDTHWTPLHDEDARAYLVVPASAESVLTVLDASPDSDDGRSQFVWVMLPGGDWILGVFPQGDTYLVTEKDRQAALAEQET